MDDIRQKGFSGFLKEAVNIVVAPGLKQGGRPERAQQPEIVKGYKSNLWGNRNWIRKSELLRKVKRIRTLPDGSKIRLKPNELIEVTKNAFSDSGEIISRDRASKILKKTEKEIVRERSTGAPASRIIRGREESKFFKTLRPGPREIKPGIGRSIGNIFRMVAGRQSPSNTSDNSTIKPATPPTEKPTFSSIINQIFTKKS